MEWPFDKSGTYLDARIEFADFTGTTIRESRLNGVRFVGVEMVDAEIDGYIENLVVNGVAVMPLIETELDRLHPVRVLMRSNDPVDLREAWSQLGSAWQSTIGRARSLPETQQHEQVRGRRPGSDLRTKRRPALAADRTGHHRGPLPPCGAQRDLGAPPVRGPRSRHYRIVRSSDEPPSVAFRP